MSQAADLARAALSRGDLIGAYDIAMRAIVEGDSSSAVRHQQLLALARLGDTDRAMELFTTFGLDRSADPHERAIGARLLKDRALALPVGAARSVAIERAYDAYDAIYRASFDPFPGINAATLAMLAGRMDRAQALAKEVLADPAVAAGLDYYMAATRAEALLILGRTEDVAEALASPAIGGSRDHGARSTTARQLAAIASLWRMDEKMRKSLLAPLTPPRVAHYCGHMFAADPAAEARLKREIDAVLADQSVGFAFGALACGADLLFAEAALARGIALNVVLPFEEEAFLAQSVRPGGGDWEARYRACVARASGVTIASEMGFFGDPAQFGYGSRMAMGLARLRAQHLGGESVQIAVADGSAGEGPAGTMADIASWTSQGGRSLTIDAGHVDRSLERPSVASDGGYQRALAAILFTDFAGFSTLAESAIPGFWDGVMRKVAEVLDGHGDAIECRNSWGDALYAVAAEAPVAARVALELQDSLADFDYATLGLDGTGGMRIGVHYGPAYRAMDHITGRITYYGTEVSKAARIEPVTPPGAVFVTEPFAAILALEASDEFASRYVGRIPLAKKYGDHPMYRLSRA